jgi:hypothetical protein
VPSSDFKLSIRRVSLVAAIALAGAITVPAAAAAAVDGTSNTIMFASSGGEHSFMDYTHDAYRAVAATGGSKR